MVNSSEQRDFELGGELLKPRDNTDNDEQDEEGEEVKRKKREDEREDERQGRAEKGEIAGDNSESNSRGSPSPERGHND